MSKVKLTTAQALVRFLQNQFIHFDGEEKPFVEGVFNIFGHGNVLGIGEALENNEGHLKVYQGKNEQGMAHAAIAYSKQLNRQKIFAVTSSSGPGSANLVTAAATAHANHIPVLFLPADTYATRQPDPVLQQIEQEHSISVTTNDALKPVSRYWDRITRPEQLMSSLIRAFEVLTDPAKAGPATICIAQDAESEAFEFDEAFFKRRVHYMDRRQPVKRELENAAGLIRDSRKPLILVGGGAKYSRAREAVMAFCNTYEVPMAETHAGKSTVEQSFHYNLGGVGILGTSAANKAAMEADLIIGAGTRYTDFTTSSKTIFNDKARFLNINVSRMHAYKLDGQQVVADAKSVLEELHHMLDGYKAEFGSLIGQWKNEWKEERTRLHQLEFSEKGFEPEIKEHFSQHKLNEYADALQTNLPQTKALLTVNEEVDDTGVVVGSAGSLPGDLQRLWESNTPDSYHLEYGYSCMGYEIAGALGVKLAEPEKDVYAMTGDGSFLMLHSELITSIQYGKKINVILFDNAGYGCISNLQMGNGSSGYQCEFRTADDHILTIDYAKVAEGYGAKVYRVYNQEQLKKAVQDAKKQAVSTLIDVKVLPKTMSDGYDGSWWNVGVAEVTENGRLTDSYKAKTEMLNKARQY